MILLTSTLSGPGPNPFKSVVRQYGWALIQNGCSIGVADYCDGWMPIGGAGHGGMENLQAACEKRGRPVDSVTLALFGAPTNPEQLAGRLDQGFTELIFGLPQGTPAEVLTSPRRIGETRRTISLEISLEYRLTARPIGRAALYTNGSNYRTTRLLTSAPRTPPQRHF